METAHVQLFSLIKILFFFQGSVGVVGIAGGKGQTVRLLS